MSVPLLLNGCGGGGGSSSSTSSPIFFTNGQAAAVVVGQTDFTSSAPGSGASGINGPYGNVNVSGGKLYLPDPGNNRLLVFNAIPVANGANADYAIGQADLNTYSAVVSDSTLSPGSALIDGGKLYVVDTTYSRIAIYNTVPTASPGTIDTVVGQPDKNSSTGTCSQTGLNYPNGVSTGSSKFVVADTGNNRVLVWNSVPSTDNTPADLVLGQADFTTCTSNTGGVDGGTMYNPGGVWTDGTRLVVLDANNYRVLIWNSFPTSNGQAADLVLGQTNLTSNGFSCGGGSASASTLCTGDGTGLYVLNNQIFVADGGNNRVLIWNFWPASNGQAADQVLGQPDFTTTAAGTTASMFNYPAGVFAAGKQLFVSEYNNNRVMIFNGS